MTQETKKPGPFSRAAKALDEIPKTKEDKPIPAAKKPVVKKSSPASVPTQELTNSGTEKEDLLSIEFVEEIREMLEDKTANLSDDSIKFLLPKKMKKLVNLYIGHEHTKESDMSKFIRQAIIDALLKKVPRAIAIENLLKNEDI